MSNEQNEKPLNVVAVPGLMSLIDVALYRTVEGQITATITSAHSLLCTWIDMKRQAINVLNGLQKYNDNEIGTHIHLTTTNGNSSRYISMESFARTCLDVACDAIQRMTTDRFAETANLSSSDANSIYESSSFTKDIKGTMKNDDSGKTNSAMVTTVIESANDMGRRGAPLEPQEGKDCWESQRLFCPDYVWADDAAHHGQRLVRMLFKNHFVSSSFESSSSNRETEEDAHLSKPSYYQPFLNTLVEQEASVLLLIVTRDLPSRLVQFRASIEADSVIIKRLYLVKSEYRAPFRAFLESHQSLQRAPSRELVNEFAQVPKYRLEHQRTLCKDRFQKLLTQPYLMEALALEQKCEEYEISMANALYGFSELARFLVLKRASIVLDDDESENVLLLLDTLRRLKSILCRKSGPDFSAGIRPILLDLQGIPRDEERYPSSSTSYFVTEVNMDRRLDIFIHQLRLLRELCCDSKRHAFFRSDKKAELDVPSSIARVCDEFDHELFRCHFEDWMVMVQRQHDLIRQNDFEELAELIRQAEIQMSLAAATNQSLDVVKLRLEAIESDREKRWEILKEILEDVCLREMNLRVEVLKPSKNKSLALQATSELGMFGLVLQMAGETLPLG